jgi:hypothetical protein
VVDVHVCWRDAPVGSCLRVIANGELHTELSVPAEGEQYWQASPVRATWYVVELRQKDGAMLALTNPIFLQPK